jgi:hypothetical protein
MFSNRLWGLAFAVLVSTSLSEFAVSGHTEANVLSIRPHFKENRFFVQIRYDNEEKTYYTERSRGEIDRDFGLIYRVLDEQQFRNRRYEKAVQRLSEEIIEPLLLLIDKTEIVEILVSKGTISYCIDVLMYRGAPLYARKKLIYRIDKSSAIEQDRTEATETVTTLGEVDRFRGLIVRDPTSDPDNACGDVRRMFPESQYFESEVFDREDFNRRGPFDFILLSCHGEISEGSENHIKIGTEKLTPEILRNVPHQLLYLDSCRLGISLPFLRASTLAGSRFALAPVISNEAGNSSTETMRMFFSELLISGSPIEALAMTRKTLFERYSEEHSTVRAIWHSFPFRLYLLNR